MIQPTTIRRHSRPTVSSSSWSAPARAASRTFGSWISPPGHTDDGRCQQKCPVREAHGMTNLQHRSTVGKPLQTYHLGTDVVRHFARTAFQVQRWLARCLEAVHFCLPTPHRVAESSRNLRPSLSYIQVGRRWQAYPKPEASDLTIEMWKRLTKLQRRL